MSDTIKELEALVSLLNDGEISNDEYQDKKSKLLGLNEINEEINNDIQWVPKTEKELYDAYKPWKQGYNRSGIFLDEKGRKHYYQYYVSNKQNPKKKTMFV